jgi:hypothetical protein
MAASALPTLPSNASIPPSMCGLAARPSTSAPPHLDQPFAEGSACFTHKGVLPSIGAVARAGPGTMTPGPAASIVEVLATTMEIEMALSSLERLIARVDATGQLNSLLIRAILQRLALQSDDPHRYVADLFEGISRLLDRVEESPTIGEYGRASRDAVRRQLDSLPAETVKDLGLGAGERPRS